MDSDINIAGTRLFFLPVETRVPLKFGTETLTSVVCARVEVTIRNTKGQTASGWGETPLSVQWVWPSKQSYAHRFDALRSFCRILCRAYTEFDATGHALEVGADFIDTALPDLLTKFNGANLPDSEPMPYLAALVCCSPFDVALHDAFGRINDIDIYNTYTTRFITRDLSHFITPEPDTGVSFESKYPADYLIKDPPRHLPAWHLVGGKDPVDRSELTGNEPDDGYPVLLEDWIRTDGLKCLKVKLRGNDQRWDYERLVKVGMVGLANGAEWMSTDFNCTVTDPAYVNEILDRLLAEHARIWRMILYVEQPFPYDLHANRIDAHSVSARKPLFMDESAHDWTLVRLGRQLGWTGVALKTCKTQTGAILSLCWAKAHGMTLMVQDLTNPMLAQIPHLRLAAHAGTIMGVETNSMQFYPEASNPERKVHPGVYTRKQGQVDLTTIGGYGFGYRLGQIERVLPPVDTACGSLKP